MVPSDSPLSPADIRAAAVKLTPSIIERAKEIAELRRLPADLIEQLRTAGAFRMLMPKAWGGPEMTPRQQVEVIEIYAAADPSVGWSVMIGSDSGLFAGFHDEKTARALFPRLDTVLAGAGNPSGRAMRVEGGYRISGRFIFGSNSQNADIIIAICPVFTDKGPVMVGPMPELRIFEAPASSWEIYDTWHSMGLAGSGSTEFGARDLFIPEEHTIGDLMTGRGKRPEPLYRWLGLMFANMAGVPLGLSRRVIDVAKSFAEQKPIGGPGMNNLMLKDLPRMRMAIARSEMLLASARAYTYESMDKLWDDLQSGDVSRKARIDVALSRILAFRTAREIAQLMVETVGVSAIFRSSPLEGLLRDSITMCMHWAAQDRTQEMLGAMLFGDDRAITLPL